MPTPSPTPIAGMRPTAREGLRGDQERAGDGPEGARDHVGTMVACRAVVRLSSPPTQPRRRRRVGRTLATIVACLAVIAVVLLVLLGVSDPEPRFAERRSRLVAVHEDPVEVIEGHAVRSVRLTAASGLRVDLLLKRPLGDTTEPRPLAILLGGHVTGRDAVKLIPDTRGTIVAALAYPYQGEHRLKGVQVLRYVPAIRAAVLDTPPAVQLAVDYLLRQPGVDTRRVEGVGVSLGAPFMIIAGARDPRITRVWAVHGSAGSYGPLELNLRRNIPFAPARAAVAGLAALLISGPRLDPERWVPRLAPRPFVMINARDDERMPRALVDQLYASAREPKSLIWVPGGHVRARPEIVRPLVDTVLTRVLATP